MTPPLPRAKRTRGKRSCKGVGELPGHERLAAVDVVRSARERPVGRDAQAAIITAETTLLATTCARLDFGRRGQIILYNGAAKGVRT
jgi:hypothetical protein